jgi:heme/copper-type cytochrome/quinol oxidase subunit 2
MNPEDNGLEFDALTHRALEVDRTRSLETDRTRSLEGGLEGDLMPAERLEWQSRLQDTDFAARVQKLERAVQSIRDLPRASAPPGFARMVSEDIRLQTVLLNTKKTVPDGFSASVAAEIVLRRQLEAVRIASPPGLAPTTAARIALSARLEAARMPAPEGLAASVSADIAFSNTLQAIPRPSLPEGFAANLATAVNLEAELRDGHVLLEPEIDPTEQAVRQLQPVRVPAGFASALAARIAQEAQAAQVAQMVAPIQPAPGELIRHEERHLTPFYFLAATLGSAALALSVLAWPYAQVAGSTALEIVQTVPTNLIITILAVLALAGFASSGRVRASLPASLAAFGLSAAIALPQTVGYFGPARVAAQDTRGTIVRVGGDLTVAGRITGDAISLGGSVRLEPGARVDGRVVTLLGDVNLPEKASVAGGVNAVLGSTHVSGVVASERSSLPNLSAASALRPLRALVSANYWRWLYLGIVCALVAVVGLLPGWFEALEPPYWRQSGQSIGLGLLTFALSLPVGLLTALTLIGAPLGLGVLSLAAVVFTLGLSISAVQLGRVLRGAFHLPRSAMLEGCLGLGVFALTLLYAPAAVAAWVLGGAWGAGALLIAWRSGRLDFVSRQLREEFGG